MNSPNYKILFPVDFSGRSVLAAEHVNFWREHLRASLETVHIVENPRYGTQVAAWRTADLEHFCQHQFGKNAARAVVLAGGGRRADQLEYFVNRERIDLVMLPRNHHGFISKLFGDSLAATLLERCTASVWMTEHFEQGHAVTINNVLCAMHFKQDATLDAQHVRILMTVRQLALSFGAEVTFLRVTGYAHSEKSWSAGGTKAGSESLLAQAEDLLGRPIKLLRRPGDVISEIGDAAGQIGADLIVVGRMRPETITFGRQSRILRIDHAVRCPVLSVW